MMLNFSSGPAWCLNIDLENHRYSREYLPEVHYIEIANAADYLTILGKVQRAGYEFIKEAIIK